ncbi:hypothetical protein JCM5350_002180 [Sporobolomyces pararoseus]
MDQTPLGGEVRARGTNLVGVGHQTSSSSSSFLYHYNPMQQNGSTRNGHNEHASTSSKSPSASPVEVTAPVVVPTHKPERPPRPMNAWLLFRNAQVKQLQSENPDERRAQGQLSKIIAELWKSASPETKRQYENLAKEKKEEHARLYPDYRYTPREKPAKKRRQTSNQIQTQSHSNGSRQYFDNYASTSNSQLEIPHRSNHHSVSPRVRHAPPPGFHPYGARSHGNPSLPPIDTSHATSTWQPLSSLSTAGGYPWQNWQHNYGPNSGSSTSSGGEERQGYRNGGPVSAPPEFSPPGRSDSNPMMRQGFSPEDRTQSHHQYSPNWPSASPSSSQAPYVESATTEHTRQHSYQSSNHTITPAEALPTFEYSLYRAPSASYALPPSPPPTNSATPSSYQASSIYPSQSPYQPQFSFNEPPMFAPPLPPPTISTNPAHHGLRGDPEQALVSPEAPIWRNERQGGPPTTPLYDNFDSQSPHHHQQHQQQHQQQHHQQQQHGFYSHQSQPPSA